MKLMLGVMLLLFASNTFAACSEEEGKTKSIVVRLTDNYCTTEEILTVTQLDRNSSPLPETKQSYPFKGECEQTDSGFKCHPKGHTVLAGTTWKLENPDVPEGKKPKCRPVWFVCVSGCRPDAPKELYGFYEAEFEGECE